MKNYLIKKLQDVVEINATAGVVNIQMNALSEQVRRMVKNKSVSTYDKAGAQRQEHSFGMSFPLSSTLQTRRDAFRARLMTKPPIGVNMLRGMVEAYMGLGADVSVQDFVIKIRYRGEGCVADLNPLYVTTYKTIPVSLLLDIAYLCVAWNGLDAQSITFEQSDTKSLTLKQLERGEWVTWYYHII